MNERIKQLLAKSVGAEDTVLPDFAPEAQITMTIADMEKFAELIVKECARLCYDKECASGSGYAQDIEEHFGVNDE